MQPDTRYQIPDTLTDAPEWETSQRERPAELFFLNPAYLRAAARETCLSEEVSGAAVRCAARIAASEPLRARAWYFHHLLYRSRTAEWDTICAWPAAPEALGEEAGRFYLVVLLSGRPLMQEEHRKHAIPAAIVRDTVLDVKLWLETEQGLSGQRLPSFGPVNVAWLANHFRANIYRLGRLQFQFGSFESPHRAFRHRESKAVLVLPESGLRYRADGQRVGKEEMEWAWESRLEITKEGVTGHPILPTGRALSTQVHLPATEWKQILAPGDTILNLHLPGDGPLLHRACGESLQQALDFFPRHYPDYHFRAFVCGSWILNTWLAEVLPPDSNLVRFQREVYLFPIPLRPGDMYWRVFGTNTLPENLSQLPRDSQLRRVILEALESGRGVGTGGGGGLLFPEDLNWGAEVYRRQRSPLG